MGFKIQMVGLLYLLVPIIESAIVLDSATIDTAWYHYKAHFNKDYDEVRERTRKPAFLESLRYVITKNLEHDLTGHWYMAGLNAVADFTKKELHCVKSPTYNADVESSVSGEISGNAEKSSNFNDTAQLPTSDIRKDVYGIATGRSVQDGIPRWLCCFGKKKKCPIEKNWVDEDRVFPVGEQECGDCYAWAATYAVSSAWAIKTNNTPLDLSVQQAKDCSYHISRKFKDMNAGCDGGLAEYVYKGIKRTEYKMIQTKDYLHYDNQTRSLSCDKARVRRAAVRAKMTSYKIQKKTSDCKLIQKLQEGPVAADICMYDNLMNWKSNSRTGIYSNFNCAIECQDQMRESHQTVQTTNHEVLIVGYTPTSWIIQNSYGTTWAYEGIGHLARNATGKNPRICNLANVISRPIA